MNNKERFLAAVRGEVPDRVPVAPLIHDRFACKLLGRTGWKAVYEVHRMIGSIWFRGPLGVGFDVDWPSGFSTNYKLAYEEGTRKTYEHIIDTPIGRLSSKVMYGMVPSDPALQRTIERFVKTEKDYEIYMTYLKEWSKRARSNTSEVFEACRVIGDDGMPNVGISCSFSHLCEIRGPEKLMVDLHRKPEIVKEALDLLKDVKTKEVEAFIGSPSEVLYYDIWGSYGLSPAHFREFVLPDIKETAELVRKADKYIGFYMVGKIRAQLPIALEARPHFIEPFELQSDITLREAKRLYGNRICLMGNLDPVVIAFGSVDDSTKEALRCLDEGMEGGGYVMTSADEVPANAKLENLSAMVKAAEKYGIY